VIKKRSNFRQSGTLTTGMTETMRMSFVFLLLAAPLMAQPTADSAWPMTFEVASIKPSAPLNPRQVMMGQKPVGMKVDAVRADIANLSLADLVRIAYRVKPYQITGPDWMKRDRFDIVGKLHEGGSQDQVPEMLQALLAQRFKLALHRETKEHAVYALVVGKNGPKLVEAPADVGPTSESAAPTAPDRGSSTMQLSADASSLLISGERTGQIRISQAPAGCALKRAQRPWLR